MSECEHTQPSAFIDAVNCAPTQLRIIIWNNDSHSRQRAKSSIGSSESLHFSSAFMCRLDSDRECRKSVQFKFLCFRVFQIRFYSFVFHSVCVHRGAVRCYSLGNILILFALSANHCSVGIKMMMFVGCVFVFIMVDFAFVACVCVCALRCFARIAVAFFIFHSVFHVFRVFAVDIFHGRLKAYHGNKMKKRQQQQNTQQKYLKPIQEKPKKTRSKSLAILLPRPRDPSSERKRKRERERENLSGVRTCNASNKQNNPCKL